MNQKVESLYTKAGQTAKNAPVESWIENFARFGYISKGVVYSLIGIFATMTAFGISGGQKTNRQEIFKIIYEQPFGKVLLGILALGLLGYVTWRFVQAIKNPDNKSGKSGIIKRIGFAISGIIYAAAAIYAAKMVINGNSGSSGNGDSRKMLIDKALELPMGQWIVGIVGLIIIIFGLYQLYRSLSGKYMKKIKEAKMKNEEKKVYKRAGRVGYISRGVVFLITGYFILHAAITFNPDAAKGTAGALSFLQDASYGAYLLGAVALGLIGYGVFMYVKARYMTFNTK